MKCLWFGKILNRIGAMIETVVEAVQTLRDPLPDYPPKMRGATLLRQYLVRVERLGYNKNRARFYFDCRLVDEQIVSASYAQELLRRYG